MPLHEQKLLINGSKIIPRSEFRIFDAHLYPAIQDKIWELGAQLQYKKIAPVETYFISKMTHVSNIKIRNSAVDIKIKVSETAQGYHVFEPKHKFKFPLHKNEFSITLDLLGVEHNGLNDKYSEYEFRAFFHGMPNIYVIDVEKIRYGFHIEDVACEFAKIKFNRAYLESICCESEDCLRVKHIAQLLGIANFPNENYIKVIKQIIGI
jgi:hypothetical protein